MWEAVDGEISSLEFRALSSLLASWSKLSSAVFEKRELAEKLPAFRRAVVAGLKSKKIPFEIVSDIYWSYYFGLAASLKMIRAATDDNSKTDLSLLYRFKTSKTQLYDAHRPLPLLKTEFPHSKHIKVITKERLANWILRKQLKIEQKTLKRAHIASHRTAKPTIQQAYLVGVFIDLCTDNSHDENGEIRSEILDALCATGYRYISCYYLVAVGSASASTLRRKRLPQPDFAGIRKVCALAHKSEVQT